MARIWKYEKEVNYFRDLLAVFHAAPYYDSLPNTIYFIVFYVVIGYILFTYALALYAYISLRSRDTYSWIISVLSIVLGLNMTVLYVPILATLFSVLDCVNSHVRKQPETECWALGHTIHACFALGFIVLFFVEELLTSVLFFESSWVSKTALARKWSVAVPLELVLRTAIMIAHTFIESADVKLWTVGLMMAVPYGYFFAIYAHDRVYVLHSTQIVSHAKDERERIDRADILRDVGMVRGNADNRDDNGRGGIYGKRDGARLRHGAPRPAHPVLSLPRVPPSARQGS